MPTPSVLIHNFCAIWFLLLSTTNLVEPQKVNGNIESRCPLVHERHSWNNLSCDEQDAFLTNIRRLKRSGIYDEFVRVHIENAEAAHGTAEFLPWHRWFIYQFELALRSVADPRYKCMSLPYWDWELDSGNEGDSSVFLQETFQSFEGTNRNGRCRFQINHGRRAGTCLRRSFNFNFPFWGEARIVALIRGYSQYGDDFQYDRTRINGFRAALEGGPHASPHHFIGGSMVDRNAPNDPLFWIHHANIDRIWSIWQDYHGHTNVPFLSYEIPYHYEGFLLDVPMSFRSDTESIDPRKFWDFRLRNLRAPTPREVLSNNGFLLKVRYVHNNPMPSESGYVTNRQWFGTPPTQIDQCIPRLDKNNPRRKLQGQSRIFVEKPELKGSQTKEIHLNQHSLRRGLSRNHNVQDKGASDFIFHSFNIASDSHQNREITTVEKCLKSNNFHRAQDRRQWNRSCRELPNTHATIGERLNELAFQDCEGLQNPRGAVDDWVKQNGMLNENVAFDCYHVADEIERLTS